MSNNTKMADEMFAKIGYSVHRRGANNTLYVSGDNTAIYVAAYASESIIQKIIDYFNDHDNRNEAGVSCALTDEELNAANTAVSEMYADIFHNCKKVDIKVKTADSDKIIKAINDSDFESLVNILKESTILSAEETV